MVAIDDDGVFSYDTFVVLFSRPLVSATVTAPTSNESWVSFNWLTGKGTLPVTLSASAPDLPLDTLNFTLSTGPFVAPPPAGMVLITGGTFEMGSTSGDGDEQPVQIVTVSSFWKDTTEETQADYEALMGANPS